jgi:DNA-binding LytR/AlgR family response regulator
MGINAIILEDEAIAARRLRRMLHDVYGDGLEVQHTFQTVADLGEHLTEHTHPDILFLDIRVADGNSFDLFDIVQVKSRVIFITAYEEFAIQALRKNAADYLLKPIKKHELIEAIDRASVNSGEQVEQIRQDIDPFKKRFLIRFGGKLHSVPTEEIAYVYSEEKLSFFNLKDGTRVPSDFRLQQIQDSLDPEQFFRVNRQFLVHIGAIEKMLRYSRSRINLELNPPYPQDIIISTETTPRFKEWMDR